MQFLEQGLWREIKRVCRDAGPRWVAVPFVGKGAAARLPLKRGDTLLTRCSATSVAAGHTDPREIKKYLRRGVRVYESPNLHAKVYVSARRAIVCSANVSRESESRLVEAGVSTESRSVMAEARRFVRQQCVRSVGPAFVEFLLPLYRPPKVPGGKKRSPGRNAGIGDVWLLGLRQVEFDEREQAASDRAKESAKKRFKTIVIDKLDEIVLHGRAPEVGELVVQVSSDGRRKTVEPISRVVGRRRFKSTRGTDKFALAVEVPPRRRGKSLTRVRKALGRIADELEHLNMRRTNNLKLLQGLARLWPGAPTWKLKI